MKCLILAAGNGGRLAEVCSAKPLVRIGGLPLIERSIATAQQAGVDEFYVVTGYASDRVEALLSEVSRRRRVKITTIHNPEWEQGNGSSLLAGRAQVVMHAELRDAVSEIMGLGEDFGVDQRAGAFHGDLVEERPRIDFERTIHVAQPEAE